MSDSEKQLDEFEHLLGSVPLTEAQGSPMQIMYLAGQHSKTGSSQPTSVRLWQLTTLASSAIAACLLVMLALPTASNVAPNSVASNVSEALDQADTIDNSATQTVTTRALIRPRRPSLIEIAQSRLPKSSINMFGDFDLEPIDDELIKKEFFE